MAYDEEMADRIRVVLSGRGAFEEKKMFGGLCYLVGGKMALGLTKDDLMVRVGPSDHERFLAEPGARPMDFTGRPMKGYVYVGESGLEDDEALATWVNRGADFALTLT